jgi:aspartyl-tRNA(Asn)/glutamyl-tRNA(Gln) amidotransferase subunit A
MQLVGRYGGDDELLDLGEAYEAQAPWAHRWPPL